jgi:hypothetical protein
MAMMMGRNAWFERSDEGIDLRNGAAPSPFSGCAFGDGAADRTLVTGSGFWDEAFYRKYNPDVTSDWVGHFIQYGGVFPERRDPGPRFSTGTYYDQNPDVAAAKMNALIHYLKAGRSEGRTATPSAVYLNEQKAAADALAAQQAAANAQQQADANALAAQRAATDKATADAALQRQLATQAQADATAAARAQADAQAAAQMAQIAAAQNANDLQAALAAQTANEAKAAADRLAAQAALDAARAEAAAFAAESHASNVTVVTGGAPAAVAAPTAEPAVSKVVLYGGLAVLALLLLKK